MSDKNKWILSQKKKRIQNLKLGIGLSLLGVFLIYLEWSILGWIITILGGLILWASYQPVTELDYQAMLSDVKAAKEQATQEKTAKERVKPLAIHPGWAKDPRGLKRVLRNQISSKRLSKIFKKHGIGPNS